MLKEENTVNKLSQKVDDLLTRYADDGEFSKFFEEDFKKNFWSKNTIETKELLYAYVQKCYDEYQNKEEYTKIIDKIDEV